MLIETDIAPEWFALWSENLSDRIFGGDLIGATQKSKVYRLIGKADNYIVKVTSDRQSMHRAILVNQYLDRKSILSDQRSVMMYSGAFRDAYYLIFSDDRLRKMARGSYFTNQAMDILSQLHAVHDRDLPVESGSHTPPLKEIVRVVQSLNIRMLDESMVKVRIGSRTRRLVLALYGRLQNFNWEGLQSTQCICHGDAHVGNFLWSYKRKDLFLIDWEYLHVNTPYFDLFQFIDATSPYEPLQNRVSRLAVLTAYARKSHGLSAERCSQRAWIRGYLFYAAYHLFWIIERIWYDLEQNQHEISQLMRQLSETFHQLIEIEHDLSRI